MTDLTTPLPVSKQCPEVHQGMQACGEQFVDLAAQQNKACGMSSVEQNKSAARCRKFTAKLTPLEQKILQGHLACQDSFRNAIEHAVEVGGYIHELKAANRRNFTKKLKELESKIGLSERSARDYHRVWREWPNLKLELPTEEIARLSIRKVLRLATAPRKTEPENITSEDSKTIDVEFEVTSIEPVDESDVACDETMIHLSCNKMQATSDQPVAVTAPRNSYDLGDLRIVAISNRLREMEQSSCRTVMVDPFGVLQQSPQPIFCYADLAGLPVGSVATPASHLYVVCTHSKVAQGCKLMTTWGFEFETSLAVVGKKVGGDGPCWQSGHYLLLVASRGGHPFQQSSLCTWMEGNCDDTWQIRTRIRECSEPPYLQIFGKEDTAMQSRASCEDDWRIVGCNRVAPTVGGALFNCVRF